MTAALAVIVTAAALIATGFGGPQSGSRSTVGIYDLPTAGGRLNCSLQAPSQTLTASGQGFRVVSLSGLCASWWPPLANGTHVYALYVRVVAENVGSKSSYLDLNVWFSAPGCRSSYSQTITICEGGVVAELPNNGGCFTRTVAPSAVPPGDDVVLAGPTCVSPSLISPLKAGVTPVVLGLSIGNLNATLTVT